MGVNTLKESLEMSMIDFYFGRDCSIASDVLITVYRLLDCLTVVPPAALIVCYTGFVLWSDPLAFKFLSRDYLILIFSSSLSSSNCSYSSYFNFGIKPLSDIWWKKV